MGKDAEKTENGVDNKGGNGHPPVATLTVRTLDIEYCYTPAVGMTGSDVGYILAFFQVFNMLLFQGASPPVINQQLAALYNNLQPRVRAAYLTRNYSQKEVLTPKSRGLILPGGK